MTKETWAVDVAKAGKQYDAAKKEGRIDGRFAGVVMTAYVTACVARAVAEAELIPGDIRDEDVLGIFRTLADIAQKDFRDEHRRALASRAWIAVSGFSATPAEYGFDEDVPGSTAAILGSPVAQTVFDRTARSLAASCLGHSRALLERDYARCVVTGVDYVDGIDECPEEQDYEVHLETSPNGWGSDFVDMRVRLKGSDQVARYRVGSEVHVMVAPQETDPAAYRMAEWRKAAEVVRAEQELDKNVDGDQRVRAAVEGIADEKARAVVIAALALADEVGTVK